MTQSFNGNGAEAVHAETSSAQSAAIAAVNHGSAAGVFALSDHGEGLHSEGNDGFAGVAAFGRGSGAGVFAKSLGGGPGIHAESTGNSPALDGVALGTGAGVFAKSLGGGLAAFFDGDVHVTGRLTTPNMDIATLIQQVRDLQNQLNTAVSNLTGRVTQTEVAISDLRAKVQ
jgi:hypothetical protein